MSANAMHSDSSPDWGTPMLGKELAIRVLAPAAKTPHAIDLDYASSAYWNLQWPTETGTYAHRKYLRPYAFLDGSKGKDARDPMHRRRAVELGDCGSGFCNPPGLDGGQMVKDCWDIFVADWRDGWLGSGLWVGFSLEQLASLQGAVRGIHPLSKEIISIIPSRRGRYLLHPVVALRLLGTKRVRLKKKLGAMKLPKGRGRVRNPLLTSLRDLDRRIELLQNRPDDSPVQGDAPTHASYLSLLPSHDRLIRKHQLDALKIFLAEQAKVEGSWFQRVAIVGDIQP